MATLLQHPRASANLDTQGHPPLPACWQPLVGMTDAKWAALEALEKLCAQWGASQLRQWLIDLEQRTGEAS